MIGVDEVGRGAWAGPLLVVAIQSRHILPKDIKDSKQLTRLQREKLALNLKSKCLIGEGWSTPNEIDLFGMSQALRLATARALKIISASTDAEIIIDGHINFADDAFKNVTTQIKADEYVPIVSCASIVAKVTRDAFMRQLARFYPAFGFDSHVGYGTARHKSALVKYGPINDIHRFTFKPVNELIK